MKKILIPSLLSFLVGCSAIDDQPVINKVEIGTKEGAHSVIVLNYRNDDADFNYRNYDIRFYLKELPTYKEFKLCDIENRCDSSFSVWKNPLAPEQNGLWFRYDLKVILSEKEVKNDKTLATVKNMAAQSILEWEKPELLTSKILYVKPQSYEQMKLTATLHKLDKN